MSTVLVTGGSGFIGSHCIIQLLQAGHSVRTTIRNLAREEEVRNMLRAGGVEPGERLSFHAADLMSDGGWKEAVTDCEYVLHVASPFPGGNPQHEDDLIVPARDGALRVLRASLEAGVKRVVLTSSFAAVGYGTRPGRAFDETDWTDPTAPGLSAYVKSKAIAERAAWDYVARQNGKIELSVVNPVGVFGPVLAPDFSTSILLVQRFMDGDVPGCPKLYFGIVDVRDVADLHIRAMTDPAASGERFIALSGDFMSMREIAMILKSRMGQAAKRVPTRELPNWMVRLAALRDPALRLITPELGKKKNATSTKAKRVLGWQPRAPEDALVATAQSLVNLGLLKHSSTKAV
ncbi:MAG: SDR family oxidoreductase [Rhizomicrobium sp.]